MSDRRANLAREEQVSLAAAEWFIRRDRGLTPSETDEFARWLAADPRHREWFVRHERTWTKFERIADPKPVNGSDPDPDMSPKPGSPSSWSWVLATALAAAAMAALGVFLWRPWARESPVRPPSTLAAQAYERRILEDGSVVELNRGAAVEVRFSPDERGVQLMSGEANFTVAKNPLRPFVVHASGVDIRAVGTGFDVRLNTGSVEVTVTEGHVGVRSLSPDPAPEGPVLAAGQRAIVPLAPDATPTRVVDVPAEEISRLLAWRPRVLYFASTPLSKVVAEFNKYNRVQLIIADPKLRSLPIVASFRSDNVEGFVRLLVVTGGVEAERQDEGDIILRSKQ